MSTEQIKKFQPDRALYLRGVDGAGAAAALHSATPTGFEVSGVFRGMADFCVLVLFDADNIFEHYSMRYLPDPDLSGMVLTFDLSYQGLQCIDSAKYSWIDWATLDVIYWDGQPPTKVVLWDHASLVSGNYSTAQGTFTFIAPGGCVIYDRVTLVVNNIAFDFIADKPNASDPAVLTADDVVSWFMNSINAHPWADFSYNSVAVIASSGGAGVLILKYARAGYVDVSGRNVTWIVPGSRPAGVKFTGLTAGQNIYINGQPYLISALNSPTSLTLTTDAPTQNSAPYLAEYAGTDGNGLTVYMVERVGNYLDVDKELLTLAGGNSENVTWRVSIDFSALGIDKLRQAWLTFAPQLNAAGPYADTEWSATFSNWSTTDPKAVGTFQIAGRNSSRVGNAETGCEYSGNWKVQSANNYWRGFAAVSSSPGASVTVSYTNDHLHDLYLGTSLYNDRGLINVVVDGKPLTSLDCYLDVSSELVTRRLLARNLAAGEHVVRLTLGVKNSSSAGNNFVFDYIEAAVTTSNIPEPLVTYPNVSPALDYDTDATYKMSPQRLLWHIQKLGFRGHMNEYLGVFWWNQRVRAAARWDAVVVTVAGTWQQHDEARLILGPRRPTAKDPIASSDAFILRKTVTYWDTVDTIADHFVYYLNSSTVAVWAQRTGTGSEFTIYPRTPEWVTGVDATQTSASGTFSTAPLSSVGGDPGYWQVDVTASNPLNYAIQQWHGDLFRAIKAADMQITASFSMELVYPPDDGKPGNEWQARFFDGSAVQTDTGFAHLVSSQCSFIPNMTAFQQKVYAAMAALQSAAGLTPWLQFGEFLWWFFSSFAADVYTLDETSVIAIQTNIVDAGGNKVQVAHGMQTGDRVVITGVAGCTSVNGTWPITSINENTFSIPAVPNGTWVEGTGHVRGGSMAYYDAVTKSEAFTHLSRDLFKFTCQNDDPSVNGGADAAFLASRLKAHVDAITSSVLALYPNAKFEILYPNDVNHPLCLLGPGVPYAQGGKMNAAVNLPPQWLTQAGSGLDSFKVEALSWSATYLNMDRAQEAIVFAVTPPMGWDPANVAYLVPWFNGTCPWPREFLLAVSRGLNLVNFWAYDHLSLMSWPIPLPVSMEKSSYLA